MSERCRTTAGLGEHEKRQGETWRRGESRRAQTVRRRFGTGTAPEPLFLMTILDIKNPARPGCSTQIFISSSQSPWYVVQRQSVGYGYCRLILILSQLFPPLLPTFPKSIKASASQSSSGLESEFALSGRVLTFPSNAARARSVGSMPFLLLHQF